MCGKIYIQQIIPTEEDMLKKINSGEVTVLEKQGVFNWPALVSRDLKWNEGDIFIDPSEHHSIFGEFVFPSSAKTIMVYTYISDNKSCENGWTWTSIHDLDLQREGK